jgi:hypothetical protein
LAIAYDQLANLPLLINEISQLDVASQTGCRQGGHVVPTPLVLPCDLARSDPLVHSLDVAQVPGSHHARLMIEAGRRANQSD